VTGKPSRVLAIDLGGTSLRAAIAPPNDPAALSYLGRWPAPRTLEDFARLLAEIEAAAASVSLVGVGITAPGLVEGTTCRWIPNLPYLDGIDLGRLAGLESGVLAAGNDAHFALLAETTLGAARGVANAILLAIGTGIGSAVLADGRIVRGFHGGAASFGWACIDMNDGGHERLGWLERNASGRALDAIGQAMPRAGDGASVIAAARAGDAASVAAIETVAARLGTALSGAVALLDPEVVLLAGGLADAADILTPPLLAALTRQLPPHLRRIRLTPGKFGPRAGLVGAAVAATRGDEWWRAI
jgi:predicted NBD/HSP70 family sugar kinase